MNLRANVNSRSPERNPVNETTQMAKETTLLNPRFYTTDFKKLDSVNVDPVRADWDRLIAELKSDPNKTHFKKTKDWENIDFDLLEPELRKELIDFLVSSLTAEFSGCVLYKEMKRRGTNPDICELFHIFPTQCEGALYPVSTLNFVSQSQSGKLVSISPRLSSKPAHHKNLCLSQELYETPDAHGLAHTLWHRLQPKRTLSTKR